MKYLESYSVRRHLHAGNIHSAPARALLLQHQWATLLTAVHGNTQATINYVSLWVSSC